MTAVLHANEQAPSSAQRRESALGSYSQVGKLILGIDPGLYGALALYDPATHALQVFDVPTLNVGKGKTRKNIVDEYALARAVDDVAAQVSAVWLEKVGTRPGEGPVGAFSFGHTYGLIRGVCVANFLTIEDVTPQKWKGALGVLADKDHARRRASALLPRSAHLWPLKKHADRAEAALIAIYGARQAQASTLEQAHGAG